MASKGNSYVCDNSYSFTDATPLKGNNFYRLKQVDNDGKFTYSKVVSANFIATTLIKISPNPVRDVLHITDLNAGVNTSLAVINSAGKIISKTSVRADSYDLDVRQLAKGIYYLRVEEGEKSSGYRFVKE